MSLMMQSSFLAKRIKLSVCTYWKDNELRHFKRSQKGLIEGALHGSGDLIRKRKNELNSFLL